MAVENENKLSEIIQAFADACCDQKRKARESGRGLQTERAN